MRAIRSPRKTPTHIFPPTMNVSPPIIFFS
jgi:hypothetical protein